MTTPMRTVEKDYLSLRARQKLARAEMWHVFSHHPNVEKEWGRWPGGCWADMKALIDWEPEEDADGDA